MVTIYFLFAIIFSFSAISFSAADDSVWTELLGDSLYAWTSEEEAAELPTIDLLKNKNVVGIYFSASWCGPCRQFTPILADFYKRMNAKGKKFEVIFVSRDRSAEEFGEYYSKMPWLAIPLHAVSQVLERLAPRFQLKGIPHLVILDGDDASVITLDGRTKVSSDKYGLEFPWRPRSLLSLVPKPIKRAIKNQVEALKAKGADVLRGVLQSMAPSKVMAYVTNTLLPRLLKFIKAQVQILMGSVTPALHSTTQAAEEAETVPI